jgi:hypothetical protein
MQAFRVLTDALNTAQYRYLPCLPPTNLPRQCSAVPCRAAQHSAANCFERHVTSRKTLSRPSH